MSFRVNSLQLGATGGMSYDFDNTYDDLESMFYTRVVRNKYLLTGVAKDKNIYFRSLVFM